MDDRKDAEHTQDEPLTIKRQSPSHGGGWPANPKLRLKLTGPNEWDNSGLEWIYLDCPYCEAHSRFVAERTIIVVNEYAPGEKEREFHTLAICQNCKNVVYVNCGDIDIDPDWAFFYHYHHPNIPRPKKPTELPDAIYAVLSEAQRCLQAGALLATLVMCRKTVETVLTERGVKVSRNLHAAIESAKDQGLVGPHVVDLAHLLRLLGNVGAHGSIAEGRAEDVSGNPLLVREAYSLTQEFVAQIYVLPVRVGTLRGQLSPKHPTE